MATNHEFQFKGQTLDGFAVLIPAIATFCAFVYFFIFSFDAETAEPSIFTLMWGILIVVNIIIFRGFKMLEPNEARVMMFFGNYKGTFTRTGFYWVNPFITTKRLSLRANNLDAEPIKVNDKMGNPVMIGQVLVWKIKDTYKATFEIDAEQSQSEAFYRSAKLLMGFYENFVKIQGDAALRKVAGLYAYDEEDQDANEPTLRGSGDAINEVLEQELRERLDMAGIEVIEARINYLAYAPEIAAVMLRRQQAAAIIAAREKIVDGAVSMVKMALSELEVDGVVKLNEEKKAAMVSNLMVVLCGDSPAQPVVSAGSPVM